MDNRRFDALARRLAGTRLTRTAALRGLTGGALAAVGASVLADPDTAAKKKKKKPVCLCPTTDAAGCTNKKARKKQAKKLASQACNYKGKCQPGVVGSQCPPSTTTTTTPAPGCPSGQTLCGAICVDLQSDEDNCGACGTKCASWERCEAGTCVPLPCGQGGPCLVFVTSTTYDGNLGGLAGADDKCQQQAAEAGRPGTYRAWLSDSTNSPSTRFVQNPGPYQLVNGTTIAADWDDLTDGILEAAISVTERGNTVAQAGVWTDTWSDGSGAGSGNCQNWTTTLPPYYGAFGNAYSTDASWTLGVLAVVCNADNSLYCFQQR